MATNGLGHEQEDLTEIYRLVHSFLVAHTHVKAAKAVRKAAKEVHIEGIKEPSHTTLESVLREWRQNKKGVESLKAEVQALTEKLASMRSQSTATQAKSYSSESSERSSSDSSSSDSSSSESSDGGEEDKKSSDSSSNGDEKDEDRDEDKDEDEEPLLRPGIGAETHHLSGQVSPGEVVANSLLQPSSHVNGEGAHNSGDNEDPADSKVTKKRKTKDGSVPTATAVIEAKSNEGNASNPTKGKTKPGRKPTVPFERIKTDKVIFANERLKDNRFESRGAGTNDYGAKASADLIVTRGAGFRKEKNKKKRGSYRGGDITMGSHSVKFND